MHEKMQITIDIAQPRPSYVIEMDSSPHTQLHQADSPSFPKARTGGITQLTYQLTLPAALQGVNAEQEVVLPIPAEHIGKLVLFNDHIETLEAEFRFFHAFNGNAEFHLLVIESNASTPHQARTDYHQLIAQRLDEINAENSQWQQDQLDEQRIQLQEVANERLSSKIGYYWSDSMADEGMLEHKQKWAEHQSQLHAALAQVQGITATLDTLFTLPLETRAEHEAYLQIQEIVNQVNSTMIGMFWPELDALHYASTLSQALAKRQQWQEQVEHILVTWQADIDALEQAVAHYQESKNRLGMREDLAEQQAQLTALQTEMQEARTEG